MHHELAETLFIGAIIGGAAVFVRGILSNAPQTQILALALIAIILCIIQVRLTLRRMSRSNSHDKNSSEQPESKRQERFKQSNPFVRELNQSWTGLMPSDTQTAPLDLEHTAVPSEDTNRDAQQSLDVTVVTVSRRSPSSTVQSSMMDDMSSRPNTSASVSDCSMTSASPDPVDDAS